MTRLSAHNTRISMTARLLSLTLVSATALTACGKEEALLTSQDYEWNQDMEQTNRGVAVGDDQTTFLDAYGAYEILTSLDGSSYEMLAAEDIPFDQEIFTILPTFIVDGIPTSLDTICRDNDIAKADILSLLNSAEYLQQHTVIYYYLTFTWKDGIITEITSKSMNYNEEAAYHDTHTP